MIIEACCETIDEALLAEKNKANRIEYCSNLSEDGLTPPIDEVKFLLQQLSIPVRVMIRPRHSFKVTKEDISTMKKSINSFLELPLEGFVLGMLNEAQRVDFTVLQEITNYVGHKKISFHKAIDSSTNMLVDVKKMNDIKQIDTILTSGGFPTAWEGRDMLIKLQQIYKGTILAAGKITRENLQEHHDYMKLQAYHGRKIV